MQKAYPQRIDWENYPSTNTALNETNLNKMDYALDIVDTRVVEFDITKANKTDLLNTISNVTFEESTGIFTFTKVNGTTFTIDTLLEKIVTNWNYNEQTQKLEITLKDGTKKEVDLSSMITNYDFQDSTEINFTIQNGKVKANVLNGSITESKLQPNFLADCRLAKMGSENARDNAELEKLQAEGYAVGQQNGVDVGTDSPYYHNNAKYYSDKAGGSSLVGLTDTDIINPTDKQSLVYDATSQKWINETVDVDLSKITDIVGYRNLIPYPYYSSFPATAAGVTYKLNNDGSIIANGTPTSTQPVVVGEFNLPKGTYTISGTVAHDAKPRIRIGVNGAYKAESSNGGRATFTLEDTSLVNIQIQFLTANVAVNNVVFKPMLEEGTEVHEFTKRIKGTLINNVVDLRTDVGYKNLIPYPYFDIPILINGVDFKTNDNGVINVSGQNTSSANSFARHLTPTAYDNSLMLENGTYVLSCVGATNECYIRMVANNNGTRTTLGPGTNDAKDKFVFVATNTSVRYEIQLVIAGKNPISNTLYPMLEEGSVAHDYVPYIEGNLISNISSVRNEISDLYQSNISYAKGDYFIHNNTLYKVLADCRGITPPNATYYEATQITKELGKGGGGSSEYTLLATLEGNNQDARIDLTPYNEVICVIHVFGSFRQDLTHIFPVACLGNGDSELSYFDTTFDHWSSYCRYGINKERVVHNSGWKATVWVYAR